MAMPSVYTRARRRLGSTWKPASRVESGARSRAEPVAPSPAAGVRHAGCDRPLVLLGCWAPTRGGVQRGYTRRAVGLRQRCCGDFVSVLTQNAPSDAKWRYSPMSGCRNLKTGWQSQSNLEAGADGPAGEARAAAGRCCPGADPTRADVSASRFVAGADCVRKRPGVLCRDREPQSHRPGI